MSYTPPVGEVNLDLCGGDASCGSCTTPPGVPPPPIAPPAPQRPAGLSPYFPGDLARQTSAQDTRLYAAPGLVDETSPDLYGRGLPADQDITPYFPRSPEDLAAYLAAQGVTPYAGTTPAAAPATGLVAIEDALLARAQAALGTTLRQYASLPGGAGQLAYLLDQHLVVPPCCYVAWRGSDRPVAAAGLRLTTAWSLIAVTQHAAGEVARRRGDAVVIGGYQIAERLARAVHDWTITGAGTCRVDRLGPIDGAAFEAMGLSLTEVRLTLLHDLAEGLDPGGLDAFITFHGDYDLAPPDGTIDAEDTVTLDQ